MSDKLITVFTPAYNRSGSLSQCYDSLLAQTSNNFVWQIVDDGSTDDTEEVVKKWICAGLIDISYIRKENGGKASAINFSLDITATPFWFCLDSDDYLTEDAISLIERELSQLVSNDLVCGLFALRGGVDGKPMQGKSIPKDRDYITQSEVRYIFGVPPEYAHVYKTDIIKKYRFPVVNGERYFPLSYIYDQIDQDYKYKFIHKPFMICEYRSDGITLNKRRLIKRNPIGYMMYKRQLIGFAPNRKEKFKAAATYVAACLLAGERGVVSGSPEKIITLLAYPVGILDYLIRYKLEFSINFEGVGKRP